VVLASSSKRVKVEEEVTSACRAATSKQRVQQTVAMTVARVLHCST
jgi:hypothetical protein